MMLEPLRRDDVPRGLNFSLGYAVEPGSRLVFIQSSYARQRGATSSDFHAQSRDSLAYIKALAARVSPDARVVKVRRYMTSSRGHRTPETVAIWEEAFGGQVPASTALEVPGSPLLGSVVDLEAWAVAPADPDVDPVERLMGERLTPEAVAVRGDQRLGVAAVSPEGPGHLQVEVRSCLEQIDAAFRRQGAEHDDVVKLTVYVRDPRSWDLVEGMVYARYGGHCPVVNGVMVGNVASGRQVEMSGWARVRGGDGDDGTVELGDRLMVTTGTASLQIFMGGEAPAMYAQVPLGTIEEQAHQGMENQRKVLEAAGATFDDVFRSNWYVTDMRDWPAIEPIAIEHFGRPLPVPMVVEVSRLTAKNGARFEPDLWAALPR